MSMRKIWDTHFVHLSINLWVISIILTKHLPGIIGPIKANKK